LIAERNEDFTEIDPWTDQVEELLNSRQETGVWPVKIPDILYELEVPRERHNNLNARRVRQIAASLGWCWGQRRHQGRPRKGLWPPTAPRSGPTVSPPRWLREKTQSRKGLSPPCHLPVTSLSPPVTTAVVTRKHRPRQTFSTAVTTVTTKKPLE